MSTRLQDLKYVDAFERHHTKLTIQFRARAASFDDDGRFKLGYLFQLPTRTISVDGHTSRY